MRITTKPPHVRRSVKVKIFRFDQKEENPFIAAVKREVGPAWKVDLLKEEPELTVNGETWFLQFAWAGYPGLIKVDVPRDECQIIDDWKRGKKVTPHDFTVRLPFRK